MLPAAKDINEQTCCNLTRQGPVVQLLLAGLQCLAAPRCQAPLQQSSSTQQSSRPFSNRIWFCDWQQHYASYMCFPYPVIEKLQLQGMRTATSGNQIRVPSCQPCLIAPGPIACQTSYIDRCRPQLVRHGVAIKKLQTDL